MVATVFCGSHTTAPESMPSGTKLVVRPYANGTPQPHRDPEPFSIVTWHLPRDEELLTDPRN